MKTWLLIIGICLCWCGVGVAYDDDRSLDGFSSWHERAENDLRMRELQDQIDEVDYQRRRDKRNNQINRSLDSCDRDYEW